MDALWNGVLDHWERLMFNPWVDAPGVAGCGFCGEYFTGYVFFGCCDGCPIYADTGVRRCNLTPYVVAADAWEDVVNGTIQPEVYRACAWEEYRFLVRLWRRSNAQAFTPQFAPGYGLIHDAESRN